MPCVAKDSAILRQCLMYFAEAGKAACQCCTVEERHKAEVTALTPGVALAGMDDAGPDCVRLLDDQTFETLDRFGLEANEVGCAIASMSFSDDPTAYYVAGTAIVIAEEPEPTKVRCHPFDINLPAEFLSH